MAKGIVWITTTWMYGFQDPMRYLKPLEDLGLEVLIDSNGRDATEEEMIRKLPGVVVAMPSNDPFNERTLAAADSLRLIARTGVGVNTIDLEAATRRGVVVTYAPGQNADSVAEHAIGLMLSAARRISDHDKKLRQGAWGALRLPVPPLRGKTLGIIGLGNVGKAVARRAAAFGMEIIARDIVRDERFAAEVGVYYKPLEEVIRRADYLSCHVPLTDLTRGMISREAIRSMKPTAFLINTSRGPVVDVDALAEELRRGTIQGAALDVLPQEPMRLPHPIFELDNVVLTPHMGGLGEDACENSLRHAVHCAVEFLSGRRPPDVVNPEALDQPGRRG
ncbi:MAG: phosphoglycerate dehydrogenase [Candidatus Tectomicrobia bacterium]|uniref:Phosphoglycerate dehydrogenase n=1 Tax=Tectimicrobiota bacterium TaxID=2528274 RepID=A0A933E8Y8_UNCTE|nr:phosphoglycerate dehydrogenase [Candidatus Tectomicrobia bacterium]